MLTLSCAQSPGIVRTVTGFLYERGFKIEEHHQFDDAHLDTFHLRRSFTGTEDVDIARLEAEFAEIAAHSTWTSRSTARSRRASSSWCRSRDNA